MAGLLVAVVTTAVVVAAPASAGAAGGAAVRDSGCADGWACFWFDANYVGPKQVLTAAHEGPWRNIFDPNTTSSAKNHFANRKVLLATGPNGTGAVFCLHEGQNVPQFGSGFNNNIESVRVTAPGGGC